MTSELGLGICAGDNCVKISESSFRAEPTAHEAGHETGIKLIGSRKKKTSAAGIQGPRGKRYKVRSGKKARPVPMKSNRQWKGLWTLFRLN